MSDTPKNMHMPQTTPSVLHHDDSKLVQSAMENRRGYPIRYSKFQKLEMSLPFRATMWAAVCSSSQSKVKCSRATMYKMLWKTNRQTFTRMKRFIALWHMPNFSFSHKSQTFYTLHLNAILYCLMAITSTAQSESDRLLTPTVPLLKGTFAWSVRCTVMFSTCVVDLQAEPMENIVPLCAIIKSICLPGIDDSDKRA